MIRRLAAAFILAATPLLLPAPAGAQTPWLTLMGDSWGFLMLDAFKGELAQRGRGDLPVLQISVPGTTAEQWASNTLGLLDVAKAVARLAPGKPVFYVSLGGNDLLTRYPVAGDALFEDLDRDLRTIVDELAAVRPDVLVLFAGYDLLKLDKSGFCLLFSQLVFGSILPGDVNPLFLRIGDIQAAIGDESPHARSFDLWGTLQGDPGNPDIFRWSPGQYFAESDEDCVHLNDEGYRKFVDALFDQILGPDGPEGAAPGR